MLDFFGDLSPHTVSLSDGAHAAALVAVPPAGVARRGVALCVHGFTGSKEDWIVVLGDIAARGYVAVAYDLRGHYESDGQGPLTLPLLAGDLRQIATWVAAEHPLPVHLVAHSMGGLIAQHAVGHGIGTYASLHLVGSGPAGVAVEGAAEQRITIGRLHEIIGALYYKPLDVVWRQKAELESLNPEDPLVRFLEQRFMATSVDALLSTAEITLDSPDQTDAAARAGLPVSWCHGERDGSWAQSTQRDAARRLGTDAVPIPDATHMPMLENGDAFVAFLCDRLDAVTP